MNKVNDVVRERESVGKKFLAAICKFLIALLRHIPKHTANYISRIIQME